MSKPRNFWLIPWSSGFECRTTDPGNGIHVREVKPIDWGKMWVEFQKWYDTNEATGTQEKWRSKIVELITKQLSGDE